MLNRYKTGFYAGGGFAALPLAETCRILAGIGYDAVELDRFWLDRRPTRENLLEDLHIIAGSGLALSEVIVQEDYVLPDADARASAVERTKAYIRRCADAGIKTVNLFTGPRPWIPDRVIVGETLSVREAWDVVFAAFDEIVPAAEEAGVNLALENVWGMLAHDFFTAQYLVNRYDSPFLGVNFDPSHDQLAGNADMEFLLCGWGRERLKHIHMKDAAGSQQRGRVLFPPLGEGLVDWTGFRRGLDAVGYDGILSVEYEADAHLCRSLGGNWIRAAEESFAALKTILGT